MESVNNNILANFADGLFSRSFGSPVEKIYNVCSSIAASAG
jgi:hypothetical protein